MLTFPFSQSVLPIKFFIHEFIYHRIRQPTNKKTDKLKIMNFEKYTET